MTDPITPAQYDWWTPVENILRKWKRRASKTEIVHPYGSLSKSYVRLVGEEAEFVNDVPTGSVRPDGRNIELNCNDLVSRCYTVTDWETGESKIVYGKDMVLFLMALDADERGKLITAENTPPETPAPFQEPT